MQRRVSSQAGDLYCRIDSDLTEKKATCVLSLADPYEVKEYFKWVTVPAGGGVGHLYAVDEMSRYLAQFYRGGQIPDPMRNHANLSFMSKRTDRLMQLSEDTKKINIQTITQEFKQTVANTFFGKSDEKELPAPLDDLRILAGLTTLDELKLVHKDFTTVLEAEQFMAKSENGDYLIRISTQANLDGAGDCTVFTVTFRYVGQVFHIRFIDVHGVGIYTLTGGPLQNLPRIDLNIVELLKKSDMKQILRAARYTPPHYACIADCLVDLQTRGFIKIYQVR